jgi:hypothetical protein
LARLHPARRLLGRGDLRCRRRLHPLLELARLDPLLQLTFGLLALGRLRQPALLEARLGLGLGARLELPRLPALRPLALRRPLRVLRLDG